MKLRRLLLIVLSLSMIAALFTGCAKSDDDILGMVGDTPIYRWYYDAYVQQQIEAYKYYRSIDLTTRENRGMLKEFKKVRLEELVGTFAILNEALKQGLGDLTAEEEQKIDQLYIDYYNTTIEGFLKKYDDTEEGYKKAEQEYEQLLIDSKMTPEHIRISLRNDYIIEKLMLQENPDIEPTEDDLKAHYQSLVDTMKQNQEEDPNWFGENYTDPLIYAPEGYRETIRIFIKFTEAQMLEITSAAYNTQKASTPYIQAISDNGGDSDKAQALKKELDRANEEFRAVLEKCQAAQTEILNAIRDEVVNGADFIRTMEEKSEDVHLISYFISETSDHLEEAYVSAAMALETPGQISEPVMMEEGVCIIKLVELIEPRTVPFEDVKDALKQQYLTNIKMNVLVNMKSDYASKANDSGIVTLYTNKI